MYVEGESSPSAEGGGVGRSAAVDEAVVGARHHSTHSDDLRPQFRRIAVLAVYAAELVEVSIGWERFDGKRQLRGTESMGGGFALCVCERERWV